MTLIPAVAIVAMFLVATTEAMFRVGRSVRPRYEVERTRVPLVTVQGATLALLALMLGFTMSMAEARFNARRQINVAEAAAVSTAFLRTQLLPPSQQSESRELWRSYVRERRAFYSAVPADRAVVLERTEALQAQIWDRAVAAVNAHPEWYSLSAYLTSVNQVFDLEAARLLAVASRLPLEIHIVLFLTTIAALGITGFVTGVGGGRSTVSLYIVPILFACVWAVVVDFDRSWFGYISTGDQAMDRVQRAIDADVLR